MTEHPPFENTIAIGERMIRFTSGILVFSISRNDQDADHRLLVMQGGTAATLNDDQAAALLQWLLIPYELEVSQHQVKPSWWGYEWRGISPDWEGPYDSRKDALDAALARVKKALLTQRDAPFALRVGATIQWNGNEWDSIENPQAHEQALQQIIEGLFEIAAPGTVKNALWQTYQTLERKP